MYQHTKTHAAIQSAISKRPPVIIVDVTTQADFIIRGEDAIVFQTRGSAYMRPYTLEEIRKKLAIHGNHEGYVSEGRAYRHVYFCDETVPADIREALAG